jgi:hypothetical protein
MTRKMKKEQTADESRGVPATLTTFGKQRAMPTGENVRAIPRIGGIQPVFNPAVYQALPELDEAARTRLYISLLTHGLQTPITLVQSGDDYIVLDGQERLELWANIIADIPDWSPPLPLRADVIPIAAIVGEAFDPARCDCLLAARAISINVARRQLDGDSVESIIKTHVLREWNDAQMQRTSNWLARDLGCSPNWVTAIRRRMWRDKELPMPPNLEGRDSPRISPSF